MKRDEKLFQEKSSNAPDKGGGTILAKQFHWNMFYSMASLVISHIWQGMRLMMVMMKVVKMIGKDVIIVSQGIAMILMMLVVMPGEGGGCQRIGAMLVLMLMTMMMMMHKTSS